jgi:diacylglycerol kinase family enzyme
VIYLRGKSVRIESTEPVPIQLDGDAAGHTPLKIDIRPACVPFLLPPQS